MLGERRIFGLRIPPLLAEGEFSVFNRINKKTFVSFGSGQQAQETGQQETRPSSMERVQAQVLEALDSLSAGGTPEAESYSIRMRVRELYPPKHWWNRQGFGTTARALHKLEKSGQITSRRIEIGTSIVHVYHRVEQPTTQASGQNPKS